VAESGAGDTEEAICLRGFLFLSLSLISQHALASQVGIHPRDLARSPPCVQALLQLCNRRGEGKGDQEFR